MPVSQAAGASGHTAEQYKVICEFYQEPVLTPYDLVFFLENKGFSERQIPRMLSVRGIPGIFLV